MAETIGRHPGKSNYSAIDIWLVKIPTLHPLMKRFLCFGPSNSLCLGHPMVGVGMAILFGIRLI
jgi:hypothetical protein